MKLTITGYSTALFATWYFVEELGLLFDAGDGVTSSLLQKARKIEHAFISHADRDHLTGLVQFNQLNARPGAPRIYYPYHSGSFPAMAEFTSKFDPHVKGTLWQGIQAEEHIPVKEGYFVKSTRNNHVSVGAEIFKSLSYTVYQLKSKLKAEYLHLSQNEVKGLIEQLGKDKMTEQVRTNVLAYSGDTPVHDAERWNNTKILIHEATFLDKSEQESHNKQRNLHSNLEEVIEMAAQLNIEVLLLGHFSSRYSDEQIEERIKQLCKHYGIRIPVYCVLPGKVHRDILAGVPVYEG